MVNNKGLLRSQNCLSITLQVKCKVSVNLSLLELCRTVAFTRNCNLYYNCKVTKNNRHYQIFVYFSLVIQKQFVSLQQTFRKTKAEMNNNNTDPTPCPSLQGEGQGVGSVTLVI